MTYNKEYINQLLKRFMDGETTEQEEQFLAEYFSTSDSIPEEWEAYRELFASFSTDAYDFTEEELISGPTPALNSLYTPFGSPVIGGQKPRREGEPILSKHRTIKLWPWLAAACVAALMMVVLIPPREENNQMAEMDDVVPQKEVSDTVKTVPMPHVSKEDKQLAQATETKATAAKSKHRIPKPKQQESIAEQQSSQSVPSKPNEPIMDEDKLMAEQASQFRDMEAAFLSHSAPIKERGQQVIRRVSMLQQEQRSQQQFVEL